MLLQGDGTPSGLSGALNVVTFCWILPARLLRCNLIGGILGTVNRMFLIVWMLLLGMLFSSFPHKLFSESFVLQSFGVHHAHALHR